ncbi:MAG TPA: KH domain-containing protein [Chthonomonadaceae bacterium]|nr:KH domain-containing protein [Chthonomonadaceae bacterium]
MHQLIADLARSLVDTPEAVTVTSETQGEKTIYYIRVAPGEEGQLIGKNGRVVRAIREIVKAAARVRGTAVDVQVVKGE